MKDGGIPQMFCEELVFVANLLYGNLYGCAVNKVVDFVVMFIKSCFN